MAIIMLIILLMTYGMINTAMIGYGAASSSLYEDVKLTIGNILFPGYFIGYYGFTLLTMEIGKKK